MKLSSIRLLATIGFLSIASGSYAISCVLIDDVEGQSAYGNSGFEMDDDHLVGPMCFCIDEERAFSTVNAGEFHQLGQSSWVWSNSSEELETVEIWSFDSEHSKVLIARTRITRDSIFSSAVGAFVGDYVPLIIDPFAPNKISRDCDFLFR